MANETKQGVELQVIGDAGMYLDIIAGRVAPPPVDPGALNERITRAMFEAETPEEAAAAGVTLNFEALEGVPIEVRDVAFLASNIKDGDSAVFMLIDGYRLDEGLPVAISTSAAQVMRMLAVWKAKGWLPSTFKVQRSEQATASGRNPYEITPV